MHTVFEDALACEMFQQTAKLKVCMHTNRYLVAYYQLFDIFLLQKEKKDNRHIQPNYVDNDLYNLFEIL